MEFTKAKREDLPEIYEHMKASFIIDEMRDYEDMVRIFDNDDYTIMHILVDGVKAGFLGLWQIDDYTFLEHFVVYEQFRNRGIGGQAIELIQKQAGKLLLEAEPPIEPMAIRRMNFYLRYGMVLNEQDYYQPPYRQAGNACYLKLMSYPESLTDFDGMAEKVYKTVYGIDYEKRKHF